MPVLAPQDPTSLLEQWSEVFPEAPEGNAGWERLLDGILTHSNHLHHPAYVGHQVSVPAPPASLIEMLVSLLSNGMAIFEMGQLHTILERPGGRVPDRSDRPRSGRRGC